MTKKIDTILDLMDIFDDLDYEQAELLISYLMVITALYSIPHDYGTPPHTMHNRRLNKELEALRTTAEEEDEFEENDEFEKDLNVTQEQNHE